MSSPAPNFSAVVIGTKPAADDTKVVPPDSKAASAKKDFFSARNVNAATSTMPAPVIQTAIGYAFHVPIRIVISAQNPLKPGMPIDAAEAMTKENAAKGSARLRFKRDRSSRSRVCVRR